MIEARTATREVDAAHRSGVLASIIATSLLVALGALFVAIVFGSLRVDTGPIAIDVPYKILARAVALLWLGAMIVVPPARRALGYRPLPSDLPLALFAAAAALSVALGGGHWGDLRNLAAAIGLALVARALFGTPKRRPLFVHSLGGLVILILVRELWTNPDLLPPHELARYGLVTANPNVLGFVFAMCAPLFLGEAIAARRRGAAGATTSAAAGGGASGARHAALAWTYYAIAVFGALITFSRTAAVGLAAGTVVVAFHARWRGIAIAVVTAAAVIFLLVQRPDTWTSTRGPGDADRLRIMRTSLSLAAESPAFGVGFGINNLEERFPDRFEAIYGERLFRFHSANQLVDFLVGTGVVGTAMALWWVIALAGELRRAFRRTVGAARVRVAGHVAALLAIGVMSLTEPPLYAGKLLPVLFLVVGYVQGSIPRDR